jgi:DNA repair protein RecN (Recombination protein N)
VGERASAQAVRIGADRATVEAVFDVGRTPGMERRLSELGMSAEDGLLILRREVAAEGRNRAWVNGSPATATAVGDLGALLVDIHGQHEHQSLLRPDEQRAILDTFGGGEELAEEVRELHSRLSGARSELSGKQERVRGLKEKAEFLRFQLGEIEGARLREGEEEELAKEARRLEHAGELALGTQELHETLYGSEGSLSDRVSALQALLSRLAQMDPALEKSLQPLEEAYHLLVETGQALGSYGSDLHHDPERIEEIRRRQDLLFRLKRKYGPALGDVVETGNRVRAELSELDEASFDLGALEETVRTLEEEFLGKVQTLSETRRRAAERLEAEVKKVFPELGLERGEFRVAFAALATAGGGGGEGVEFQVSLNPGFEPGPLSKIASGGELSRVMLALKAILAGVDRVPTLIFDEIDAGIGGEVALRVASKLESVSANHQVFVITHLPQLAARAHHQHLVEKGEMNGLASTRVRALEGKARVREIARMLGGDPDSPTSRDHARELLAGR